MVGDSDISQSGFHIKFGLAEGFWDFDILVSFDLTFTFLRVALDKLTFKFRCYFSILIFNSDFVWTVTGKDALMVIPMFPFYLSTEDVDSWLKITF